MAIDRTPVLKRCRSLGLDPVFLGIDKKSNRTSTRGNRKRVSTDFSSVKNRKRSLSTVY